MALSKRDNQRLRADVVFDGLAGVRAVPTAEAVSRFDSWYSAAQEGRIVVENQYGERAGFRTPNRFTPKYREMLYARTQSLERSLREKWGRLLHTAMVTLTASTTDENGRPRPLVDHLLDLLESWEAVRRALSRVLDGREWEYLAILEPHESGHVHIHLGVFVKGPIVAEQFQPVIDAHLRNCPSAGAEAHQIFDEDGEEDAVTIHRAADPRNGGGGIENLGAYLAAYMAGEYGLEATEMPANVRAFYTALWATGKQWFRPSNGAQQYMQPASEGAETAAESDGPDWVGDDWQAVAYAPEGDVTDEEMLIEIDPESGGGGIEYRRTRFEDWPGPD